MMIFFWLIYNYLFRLSHKKTNTDFHSVNIEIKLKVRLQMWYKVCRGPNESCFSLQIWATKIFFYIKNILHHNYEDIILDDFRVFHSNRYYPKSYCLLKSKSVLFLSNLIYVVYLRRPNYSFLIKLLKYFFVFHFHRYYLMSCCILKDKSVLFFTNLIYVVYEAQINHFYKSVEKS